MYSLGGETYLSIYIDVRA